jgi:hypothetical protein
MSQLAFALWKRVLSETRLLIFDTAATGALSSLDALLVSLDLAAGHGTHHSARSLPWSLQVTGRRLTQEMNFDKVALESALERDDGLNKKRVRVLEIDVHNSHHADTHQLRLVELAELLEIVGLDRGRDELGLFAGTHGSRLNVFDDSHVWRFVSANRSHADLTESRVRALDAGCQERTILLVDLLLDIEVDARNDQIGDDIERAHAVEDIWVIERNLLGDLHEPPTRRLVPQTIVEGILGGIQDDDEVGTRHCR